MGALTDSNAVIGPAAVNLKNSWPLSIDHSTTIPRLRRTMVPMSPIGPIGI